MAEHAHVVRVTTFVPADGRAEDLLEACRQIAGAATEAEGCFGAQVCEVSEQPGVIAVVSRWRDRSSLDAFLSAHSARLGALEPLLGRPGATVHYVSAS